MKECYIHCQVKRVPEGQDFSDSPAKKKRSSETCNIHPSENIKNTSATKLSVAVDMGVAFPEAAEPSSTQTTVVRRSMQSLKPFSLCGSVFPPGGVNAILDTLLHEDILVLRLNGDGDIAVHAGRQLETDTPLGFVTGALYVTGSAASAKELCFKLALDDGFVVHVNQVCKNMLGYIQLSHDANAVNIVFTATGAAFTCKKIKEGRALVARDNDPRSIVTVPDISTLTPVELLLKRGLFARSTAAAFDGSHFQLYSAQNLSHSLSYALATTYSIFFSINNIGNCSLACLIGKEQTFVNNGECLLVPAYVPTTTLSSDLQLSLFASEALAPEHLKSITEAVQVISVNEFDVCLVAREMFPPWKERVHKDEPCAEQQDSQQSSTRSLRAPHSFSYNLGRDIIPIVCTPALSSIAGAGMGLFAIEDISENDLVTWYGGHLYHKDEYNALPDSRKTFALSIKHDAAGIFDYVIDGEYGFGSSLGRFINRPTKPMKANVHAVWKPSSSSSEYPSGYIAIKATRAIAKDDEIFMSYGKGYVKTW